MLTIESDDFCFMIYNGSDLYIINKNSVNDNIEKATEIVNLILEKPQQVVVLSHNGDNINYKVNNVLVNKKVSDKKYRKKDYRIVHETSEMYSKLSKKPVPTWITNIFNGTAKGEIIYQNTEDYMLMPDFKWDHDPKHLYFLVLYKDKHLRSIRDLRKEDISLLENTQDMVLKYIYDNYEIPDYKLRLFFHYQPSAWQLHLHVQHIDSPITSSAMISRAISLSDVIQNLSIKDRYYREATLECIVSSTDYNKFYC